MFNSSFRAIYAYAYANGLTFVALHVALLIPVSGSSYHIIRMSITRYGKLNLKRNSKTETEEKSVINAVKKIENYKRKLESGVIVDNIFFFNILT